MDSHFITWVEYLLRFSHLVAGIYWIGSSFYFIWLDSSFEPPEKPQKNTDGELFMVHGGFYYQVLKKKFYPGELPKTLHWFKWEATITWITGIFLFFLMYYLNGAGLMLSAKLNPTMTQFQVIAMSLSIIILSWLVYDFIWLPRFEKFKFVSLFISVFLFFGIVFLNTYMFSGRGAYILTGVIMGTMMVLNVWVRILPGQRKMLAQAESGQIPDYSLGLKAKSRSIHNTYFTFPVLLIMISNHYAFLYNSENNGLFLILLALSGAFIRHAMVAREKAYRWLYVIGFGILFYLFYISAPKTQTMILSDKNPVPEYSQIKGIFQTHCLSCHSSQNTDKIFTVAPKNFILETEEQIKLNAASIYQRVWVDRNMPFNNQTQITEAEREAIARFTKKL